jgi:hypothetical protein
MYHYFLILLLPLLYYYGGKFCAKQTDGFTLLKIQSALCFDPRFATEDPPHELSALLEQSFTYLNSGGQCYAFLSQDGQVVIKFFKHHLRRLPWLFAHFPLPAQYAALREKQKTKRERKLLRDFTSYKLSYEQLRKESGLLYVHLNKTEDLGLRVTLIDKLGISHELPLDRFEFVVQKRADLALEHFQTLIAADQLEKAKKAIDSTISLIVSRCQKGIYDEDPRLHRNLGFLGEEAMLIDVGRLRVDESRKEQAVYRRDVIGITAPLKQWLLQQSPELAQYLEKQVENL